MTEVQRSEILNELRSYLNLQESDDLIYEKCQNATSNILKEWQDKKIDPTDLQAVTDFYVNTNLYCFELIGLEISFSNYRHEQMRELERFLKKHSALVGCDYGSGIGTLGIHLNESGIVCDFADVSAINLGFISQRLKKRGLDRSKSIHLLKQSLAQSSYDFITAFDVLEHVTDPVGKIIEISDKLKVGGYFIFNVLCELEDNTPHLLKDPHLIRKKIRGLGFKKIGSIGEFKIYQKVARSSLVNSTLGKMDEIFWDFRKKIKGS